MQYMRRLHLISTQALRYIWIHRHSFNFKSRCCRSHRHLNLCERKDGEGLV